jgi:tetratricopeptide (TPR) repeat protein
LSPLTMGDPDVRLEPPQEEQGVCPLFLAAQPALPDWDMVARFVGRGEERVRLASWLSGRGMLRPHAIFGLTGVGGIGKTALALATAAREGWRFGNRVAFVSARERADQFSMEAIYGAVVRSYGIESLPEDPRQREGTVVAALNDPARPCLLILDNLEELSQSQAAQLAVFLRQINPQSGRSAVLVTLRPDEKPPLDELIRTTHIRLPDLTEPDSLRLVFNEVIEKGLWAQVPKQAVRPGERLRVERAALFASLERLPVEWLASLLSLAGAAAFHPEMIRLAVGKIFGTRNWGDTLFIVRELEPQRDVQAAVQRLAGRMVDDLIDPVRTPDETLRREGLRVLQALAVFVGGATRRSLQYVARGDDVPDGPLRSLAPEDRRARLAFEDLLGGLVGRNLVRRAGDRYDLHPLIHACLRDHYPPDSREEVAFRLHHAQAFLPVAADYDDAIREGRMGYNAPIEWANAVAAMDWMSVDVQSDQPVACEVLVAYSRHWRNTLYNSYHPRRLMWLEAALAATHALRDSHAEANVLQATGDVLAFLKRNDEALARYEEALSLYRAVGARLGEANALLSLGDLARKAGRYSLAWQDYEKALSLYGEVGDRYSLARALYRMGDWHAAQGDPDEAIPLYQRAIGLWRSIGLDDLADQILAPRLSRALHRRSQVLGQHGD